MFFSRAVLTEYPNRARDQPAPAQPDRIVGSRLRSFTARRGSGAARALLRGVSAVASGERAGDSLVGLSKAETMRRKPRVQRSTLPGTTRMGFPLRWGELNGFQLTIPNGLAPPCKPVQGGVRAQAPLQRHTRRPSSCRPRSIGGRRFLGHATGPPCASTLPRPRRRRLSFADSGEKGASAAPDGPMSPCRERTPQRSERRRSHRRIGQSSDDFDPQALWPRPESTGEPAFSVRALPTDYRPP